MFNNEKKSDGWLPCRKYGCVLVRSEIDKLTFPLNEYIAAAVAPNG